MRRWALGQFSDRELKAVELRANGIDPQGIAQAMGCSYNAAVLLLWSVRRKAGLKNTAEMIEWAKVNALDVPLEPETVTPALRLPQKRGRKRIKMGRIRRANYKRIGPNLSEEIEKIVRSPITCI